MLVGFWGGSARAATIQTFDGAGTPYVFSVNNVLPVPAIIAGGPAGNFLRLAHTNVVGNVNAISFNLSDPGTYNRIEADFDFRLTGLADGFGFALLNTGVFGTAGGTETPGGEFYQEPNMAGTLGVGFDIYQNTEAGELNGNHISIHFNGAKLAEFTAAPVNLKSGDWVHAKIILRPGNGFSDVTVILTPAGGAATTVVNNYVVPGFVPYQGRVHFGARSGGLSANHDLDSINVDFSSAVQGMFGFAYPTFTTVESYPMFIHVSRYGGGSISSAVNFATSNLSAVAGTDYVATNGTLTFLAGEVTKFFRVLMLDNPTIQTNRQFAVHLSAPTGGAGLDTQTVATATIVDDDDVGKVGAWSSVIDMPANPYPIVPIHISQLPNGKIILWDRGGPTEPAFGGADGRPYLWDVNAGTFTVTAWPGYDLFCTGYALMADGRLFVAGGHLGDGVGENKASIYDPASNVWTRLPDMTGGRWYPTVTTLANGDMLVEAGTVNIADDVNKVSQIWQVANSTWRNLTAAESQHGRFPAWANYYPFMYLAPNGKVFCAGPQQIARYLDTTGTGIWTDVAASSLIYRDYGTSVLYADGKVMITGGNPAETYTQPSIHAQTASIYPSRITEVINLNDPTPTWRQAPPALLGRRHGTAVLLPDGNIFLCNGSAAPGFNVAAGKALMSEMWNPLTEQWTAMAANVRYRGYHAAAFLLPDGRVAATGGGHPNPPDDLAETSAELYSPPYLFRGPRPVISGAPEAVTFGETFTVRTPDAAVITNVVWLRCGNTTHAFDQNQRINRLPFTASAGELRITAPTEPNLCPPGHYFLFLNNTNGVPSLGKTIRIAMGILSVQKSGANNLVTVTTVPGTRYTVEYSAAVPNAGAWTAVASGVTATAVTTVVTDVGGAAATNRFYRVRQVP